MTASENFVKNYLNKEVKLDAELIKKFDTLLKKKPKNSDSAFQNLHYEAFELIDCLDCANCCKSLSPGVSYNDVEKLAKYLRIKPSQVVETYFTMDKEGDYVFKLSPCPFLKDDNYCMVYESRPKACREYPHTDRRRILQLMNITKKNVEICPGVFYIMDNLKV
jgi:uncharacterized protein